MNKLKHTLGYATPLHLTLNLNRACNMRCPHCQWLLHDKNFFDGHEMDIDDAENILFYYRKRGITSVTPQAEGEVLLYKGLKEVAMFAKLIGYTKINLITNGLLLNQEIADCFTNITVSIDGYDRETYKLQRGLDVFDKLINNIKLLNRKVVINCIIGKFNLNYIEPMIRMAERLGVERMRFGAYDPELKRKWLPLYAGDKEVEDYYREITSKTDWKVNITLPSLYKDRTPNCTQLYYRVLIGSRGDFTPCCRIPTNEKYGNYFDSPVAFNRGEVVRFRRRFKSLLPSCKECPRLSPQRYNFVVKDRKWYK